MNKWFKLPLIFGVIGAVLGIFFHPFNIWNNVFPKSVSKTQITSLGNVTQVFSLSGIIDGLIIGIVIGLIISLFTKRKAYNLPY